MNVRRFIARSGLSKVEIASSLASGAFLLAATLACGGGGGAAASHDTLPQNVWAELGDQGRGDPWHRLAQFEHEYRSGFSGDPWFNYASDYKGRAALLYPKYVRRDAAWDYVLIGRDFAARGEWGAAARADWAALSLVRKTVASRPDRERIRRAAYRDLANVARQRGQKQWAELLEACAVLVDVYLETPKAHSDQDQFYAVIRKIEQAEQAQASAQAAQDRAAFLGAISAGIQQGQAYALAKNNPQAAINMSLDNLKQTFEFSMNLQQQSEQLREAAGAQSEYLREFAGVVADDVTEIDAGLSFVAREATFFLLGSERDVKPYTNALRRWGQGKARLLARLDRVEQAPSAETIHELARELQRREVHAARYERRGLEAPPYPEEEDPTPSTPGAPAAPGNEAPAPPLLGTAYEITEAVEPDGVTKYSGSLELEAHGNVRHCLWNLAGSGVMKGVGLVVDTKLYVAWSRSRDVGVSVYTAEGNRLRGTWSTLNSGESVGEEILDGPGGLQGRFVVSSGKLPGTGAGYTGSATLAPTGETFDVRWNLAGEAYRGIGILQNKVLAVGWAPGDSGAGITIYDVTPTQLTGVWAAPGGTKLGREVLKRTR